MINIFMTILNSQQNSLYNNSQPICINTFPKDEQCAVCFLPFNFQYPPTNLMKLDSYFKEKKVSFHRNCSLLIHEKCLLDWCVINNSCPQCRYRPILSDSIREQRQIKNTLPTNPHTLSLNGDVISLLHENTISSTFSCCEKIKRILRRFI